MTESSRTVISILGVQTAKKLDGMQPVRDKWKRLTVQIARMRYTAVSNSGVDLS